MSKLRDIKHNQGAIAATRDCSIIGAEEPAEFRDGPVYDVQFRDTRGEEFTLRLHCTEGPIVLGRKYRLILVDLEEDDRLHKEPRFGP